jgi:RHH-type proline utilization regulon transcriptional repressor/proline dehydrogenase/delta 1-pyrroline-5-carboxylate dehydrogenase
VTAEPTVADDDSLRDAERVERAIARADALLRASQASITSSERERQERLGRLVADPAGRDLVFRLTDEVLRLERPRAAADRFAGLVSAKHGRGIPPSISGRDRFLMAAGARAARVLPRIVMPLVKRRIVAETRGLIIPADAHALTRHLRKRAAEHTKLNLNVLGEAILSDAEAEQRIQRVIGTLQRPDVDYISVKISAVCALLDVYAFEHSVQRICQALRRIYDAAIAADPPTFVNLDMEEYADLELTVESFLKVLDEPPYVTMPAGIVLQAYVPDSHVAMERIGEWAAARVARGGAPIKVRIVKGANLAMEQVDAEQHGWALAPYATKADTDASYKRLLDSCLRPEWAGAVRVGVASHNLFEVAWALTLRDELPESRRSDMEIEMLEGMVPAQTRAVQAAAGGMLLYCPIVREDEFDASLAYLSRRFDENTAPENFLRAMFTMTPGSAEFADQAERFRQSVAERSTVAATRRRQPVALPTDGSFENHPDTDFTDAAARDVVQAAVNRVMGGDLPDGPYPLTEDVQAIDAVVATASSAVAPWSATPPAERAALLRAVADVMDAERGTTLAAMAVEAAKTVREGDPEVCEAIDFARFYATAEVPSGPESSARPYGVVVVASPWNFPYAIPAGGVLAALMAGNTVILKPPPETRQTAWLLANQCWRAGVPRDVLQFVACPDNEVGTRLITHDDVATVVLTGAYATAQLFLDWKPSLRLLAETSGKNAIVVTESADMDAAIRDIVRSAFGHAGQKCSAASLAILTAPVYDDPTFLPRLAAAVRSVRVGEAVDPSTMMAPLIGPPAGPLFRALTTLEQGERWLVEPRERPGSRRGAEGDLLTSRRWTPGVRVGVKEGSWFHQIECFGPVLGVMRADDLDHAIRIQNGTPFGLTGGLQSLDDAEIDDWLGRVEVGNAYVNRHITGAIVQRQPFGGWKRSSMGGAPKAGGPHYVHALLLPESAAIDVAAAAASYEQAWTEHFATGHDFTGLRSESNVLRHVPVRHVLVRAGGDTPPGAVDAARRAAAVCGVTVTVSMAAEESYSQLIGRVGDGLPIDRLRGLTDIGDDLARACHARDIAVDRSPVSANGLLELPHWLREQAISRTLHRYGSIREPRHP